MSEGSSGARPGPLVGLAALRAPFVTASALPALVSAAWSWQEGDRFSLWRAILAVLGAAVVHLAANVLNDYADWDESDRGNRFGTPFSGGSRVRLEGLMTRRAFLAMGVFLLVVALGLGLALALTGRPWVPLIGLAGALGGILYSVKPFALVGRGVGEAVILVCFGPLITFGTGYAIEGSPSAGHALLGLPLGFLTANILWMNEFPDIEADARAGKRTLVVRLGSARARWGYVAILAGFAASIVALVAIGLVPPWTLLALAAALACIPAVRLLWRDHANPTALVPAQAGTIRAQAIAGIVMAACIVAWHWIPWRPVGERAGWLVMVFVNADSGGDPHEWIITRDLEDLDSARHPEGVEVVVQASRCGRDSWDGGWKGTRRYRVAGPSGRDPGSFEAERLPDPPGPVDPSDGDALAGFVEWATSSYPADHRMLVIEAHGSGWRGLSPADIAEDPGDLMSIQDGELGSALARAAAAAPIDVVVLDACLMGMWEAGFALRGASRYALTSEEIGGPILGSWPDVLDMLGSGPADARAACAAIPGMLDRERTRANSATRTCVDVSGHEALTGAVDALAAEALADGGSLAALGRAIDGALRFTKPAHVDLGDLASLVSADPAAGTGMAAAARALAGAIDGYVVSHESAPFVGLAASHGVCGPPGQRGSCARSTGVAIWAPVPPPPALWPVYMEGPWSATRWDEALAALASLDGRSAPQ